MTACRRATIVQALAGLFALLGTFAGPAAADELPRSPACRTALQALDDAEAALAAAAPAASGSDAQRQRAATARLQPLRVRVADACLGGLTTSPPPSQRTLVVPPPAMRSALPAPRVPAPAVPPVAVPSPRVQPPVTVTSCNGAVCIASDGSTLTRMGPTLVGPRGQCTVQGGFVRCP